MNSESLIIFGNDKCLFKGKIFMVYIYVFFFLDYRWISGVFYVYSLFVWVSCIRYLFNFSINDR